MVTIRRVTIALGSDHAGFLLKEVFKTRLAAAGYQVRDFGTHSAEPVDYPAFVRPAAEAVAAGECERGIVFGGSGNGEAMVANRLQGVRCAVCWNVESARLARAHNDANIISVGARLVSEPDALAILETFLSTPFEGGRHAPRIKAIDGN